MMHLAPLNQIYAVLPLARMRAASPRMRAASLRMRVASLRMLRWSTSITSALKGVFWRYATVHYSLAVGGTTTSKTKGNGQWQWAMGNGSWNQWRNI
jgi:hypothetical protein